MQTKAPADHAHESPDWERPLQADPFILIKLASCNRWRELSDHFFIALDAIWALKPFEPLGIYVPIFGASFIENFRLPSISQQSEF